MTSYRTWIVIQNWDGNLRGILQNIGNPDLNPFPRERISLRCRDDNSVEFCVAEPEKVFKRIPTEGEEIQAITSAPYDEVHRFHNRVLQYEAGRYRILCHSQLETSDDSPYKRRFLSIRNETVGVATSPDPRQPIEPRDPEEPNLWLQPELIELTEQQVAYCFGRDAAANLLMDSFMLPPFRTLEDPPVGGTYFNESLIELRRSMFKLLGPANPLHDPAACTMVRLCDDPLLRDVFIEGGSLQLTGEEGMPTEVVLHLEDRGQGAETFRSGFILDPDRIAGPKWASSIGRAVHDDIRALLPDNGLEIVRANQSRSWDLGDLGGETVYTGGSGGTWDYLQALQGPLVDGSGPWRTLWDRVLYKSSGTGEQPDPDNDRAERLFIAQAWRPPWEYQWDRDDPWKDALREILMWDFKGIYPTPEERVEQWNNAQHKTNFRCHRGHYEQRENPFFLDYSGAYDPDLGLRWRLLLPLWTTVSARTLYLDLSERSRLDAGFVLA